MTYILCMNDSDPSKNVYSISCNSSTLYEELEHAKSSKQYSWKDFWDFIISQEHVIHNNVHQFLNPVSHLDALADSYSNCEELEADSLAEVVLKSAMLGKKIDLICMYHAESWTVDACKMNDSGKLDVICAFKA